VVEMVAARFERFTGRTCKRRSPLRTTNRIGVVFYMYCK
jgi:hypothetical protein